MLKDIIKELNIEINKDSSNILENAVSIRLDKALKAYYADLNSKFNSYENRMDSDKAVLRTAKALIK